MADFYTSVIGVIFALIASFCFNFAVIFQKKGLIDKAAEYYEKFLGLWNEADAIFPEIDDARKQLNSLKDDSDVLQDL